MKRFLKELLLFGVFFLGEGLVALDDGLARTPPMGWNSWNSFQTNVNEEVIKEIVDAMIRTGMRDAGYEYIIIDDGWEAMERDKEGKIVPDPKKFPKGMKALGDYIHSKGFKFGIHNDAGTRTCAGYPGGRGHEFLDAKTYASWGVDYLKYDWCNTGSANAEETYKTMRDALKATGRPIIFSICEWGSNKPWLWGKDVGHLWRTTGDIMNCYDCQGVYSLGWKVILDEQVGLEKYAGPGHWNDPDMLVVGMEGLSLAESRSHFSLWCILAAPLIASNDIRNMSEEIRQILTNKEVIAIDQDSLGKQGYKIMDHPGKEIWVKELSGGAWAVCFHNTGEEPLKMKIIWGHLWILRGKYNKYKVRDLWEKKDLGIIDLEKKGDEFYIKEISPHDVLLLKFTPIK
ncbi:MAG: glycoside hydrolase family 27 protein [candidate division WOR-3 bacterium]